MLNIAPVTTSTEAANNNERKLLNIAVLIGLQNFQNKVTKSNSFF